MIFSFTWTEDTLASSYELTCPPSQDTHLRDGVTVQHLDRGHVRALAVHQHLQGLRAHSPP